MNLYKPSNTIQPLYIQSSHKDENHLLTIICWNVSSCKKETFDIKRKLSPNIFFFQEIRNYSIQSSPSYNVINAIRNDNTGGGIAIGVQKQFTITNITHKVPKELLESIMEIIVLQIHHQLFSMIALNIYIPFNNKFGKKLLNKLRNWIIHLQTEKPNTTILVCGDFNTSQNPIPTMYNFTQNIACTFKREIHLKSNNSIKIQENKLDLILCNKNLQHECNSTFYAGISDHALIHSKIYLEKQNLQINTTMIIPNKKITLEISKSARTRASTSKEFLENHREIMKRSTTYTKQRLKINQFQEQKKTFDELVEQIDSLIRTQQSRISYQTLKRICIIHPNKRDGDLFKCFTNEGGVVITEQQQILKSCLLQIGEYSTLQTINIMEYNLILKTTQWPNLPALSEERVAEMHKHMSQNKAIVFDGFIDNWFKKLANSTILADLWNHTCMSLLNKTSFSARLIPLNKKWPDIPSHKDFRPIVVLSPMLKWLELRFLINIQMYIAESNGPKSNRVRATLLNTDEHKNFEHRNQKIQKNRQIMLYIH
ncbi:hypothetical protein ABPG72_021751 [Tetrahymena utriculariae]